MIGPSQEISYPLELTSSFTSFVRLLREVIQKAVVLHVEEERVGGYFCWADQDGRPLLMLWVGYGWNKEASRVRSEDFCREKARRLASHPEDVSSWQSRNPDMNQWGGAICHNDGIFSFSGFPEELDEAVMLKLAVLSGKLSMDGAMNIGRKSRNSYFQRVMNESLD